MEIVHRTVFTNLSVCSVGTNEITNSILEQNGKVIFRSSITIAEGSDWGALLLCPCLFRPSDNVRRSRRADAPRCAHFFYCYLTFLDHRTYIRRKVAHQGVSARRERQTSFKIVSWTKQTRTKHHNTP